ncbi:MAG TPA: adenylyl-sulfate kinase [Firmicutes bacterium]|nr:adenylyl-sulfate kinase [Bacillota bacterium]
MPKKGLTVWFTGLSAAGKTTIALAVEKILKGRGIKVERLDGDTVRKNLTKDLGFSKEDRDRNIERVSFVAMLLTRNDVIVLCSFISPYREERNKAKATIGSFVEVYVKASVEECSKRDPKGLYKKALAGEIEHFTGVSDPYEEPIQPDLICNTLIETEEESVQKVITFLEENDYIEKNDSPEDVYSDEEREKVQKRLEDLGYI